MLEREKKSHSKAEYLESGNKLDLSRDLSFILVKHRIKVCVGSMQHVWIVPCAEFLTLNRGEVLLDATTLSVRP